MVTFFGICAGQDSPVLTGKKMEVLKKGEQVIFSDGAEIKQGTTKIFAETIIHNRPDNLVEIKDNVRIHYILKSSATIDISGASGSYQLDEKSGRLLGSPGLIEYLAVNSTEVVKLQCRQIDFNLKSQDVAGQDDVRLYQKNWRIRADTFKGNFSEPGSFLTFFSGADRAVESFYDYSSTYNLYFYSRQLNFYPEQKQVKFTGMVEAKIIPR